MDGGKPLGRARRRLARTACDNGTVRGANPPAPRKELRAEYDLAPVSDCGLTAHGKVQLGQTTGAADT
jgi:hypothetical protein